MIRKTLFQAMIGTLIFVAGAGHGPRRAFAGAVDGGSATADFLRDIQPIFAERCYSCHGPQKQRGGLRLDSKVHALRGGDSGPVLQRGAGGASRIIERVTARDKAVRM